MKRIISLVLIFILSLGVLTACDFPWGQPDTPDVPDAPSYDLNNAKAFLKDLYPELFPTTNLSVRETRNTFHVNKILSLKDGTYTVAWSVVGEGIEVVDYSPKDENDIFTAETTSTVKIPDSSPVDINYTLTATITAPDATTLKVDLQLVVPASNVISIPDALAKADGEVVEVKGTVETIDTAWSDSYGNISVTIKDAQGNKLYLYRLSTKVEVGDIIVVTGTMATYNGARQIAQGATAKIVGHEDISVVYEKLSIAEVLASDDGRLVEVSGTVINIGTPWDDGYGNISVTIKDAAGNELYVYRLSTKVELGDVITLKGKVGSHNGAKQIAQGATAVITGHEDVDNPNPNPNPNPDPDPADSVVLNLTGNANLVSGSGEKNVFAANGITLTNNKAASTSDLTVQADYAQRFYANSSITIEYPGMTKIVLTLDDYSSGKYLTGFDGMTVEGATITRENDVVTIVFSAPTDSFTSSNFPSQVRCEKIEVFTGEVEGGGNNGGEDGGDDPVVTPTYTAPVAGQAYNFFMELPSGKVYFAGSMSGDYLATTTDASASVAIYFEEVAGGYHIYFMNGETKTYITAAAYLKSNGYAGCHFYLTTDTPTLAWTYNTTYGIIEIYDEVEGKSDTFFAGTYGTYSTVSLSGAYYKDQISSGTQYPARLEVAEGGNGEGGEDVGGDTHEHVFVEGKCECGEVDPNYQPPAVEGPVALTSLKTGDKVYIVCPSHNMALSATKIATYYNLGVDVSAGFGGLSDAETWEVTVNDDGTYTFTSLTGKVLALADSFASLNDTGANKYWALEEVSSGLFKVKNTGRGNYLEWYADKGNWSTFSNANSDLFYISFYSAQ